MGTNIVTFKKVFCGLKNKFKMNFEMYVNIFFEMICLDWSDVRDISTNFYRNVVYFYTYKLSNVLNH